MTFGRWGFAATTRRANELGYSAFFVVSAVARPNRRAPPGYGTVAFGAA